MSESMSMVERVALAIWQTREKDLPPHKRRMKPDEIDRASGAWLSMLEQARAAIEAMPFDEVIKQFLDVIINYLARLHPPTEVEAEFGNAMLEHIRWIRDRKIKIPELDAVFGNPAALSSEAEGE